MKNVFENSVYVCIAPHPDDETLGCGGLLLRAKESGAKCYWVIITEADPHNASLKKIYQNRSSEIQEVAAKYCFDQVFELKFRSAKLTAKSQQDLIPLISDIIQKVGCTHLLIPYRNDIHSDHKITHDASLSASKSFRCDRLIDILMYETLSETDFSIRHDDPGFKPNFFVNIEKYIDEKLNILSIYKTEVQEMPFPRSIQAVRALATLRGVQSNSLAAEGYISLKRILR